MYKTIIMYREDSLIMGGSNSEGGEEAQRTAHNTARAILPRLSDLHDVLLNPPKVSGQLWRDRRKRVDAVTSNICMALL